jgi:uncharacterized membrane protein YkoI
MFSTARKTVTAIAAFAALALGGSVIANAATSNSTTSSNSTSSQSSSAAQGYAPQGQPPSGAAHDPSKGGHVANGKTETLLTGDTAAKVKAAALAKVPGGTVERVETDADHGSPYEAHVKKSDGTELEVLIDKDFNVTAVNTMQR